jgi:hypothetical protein
MKKLPLLPRCAIPLVFALVAGCGSAHTGTANDSAAGAGGAEPTGPGEPITTDPGELVTLEPNPGPAAEATELRQKLDELGGLSAAGLAERFPSELTPAAGYDLASVAGLDKIQASTLKLGDAELAQLRARGFSITDEHPFPSFVYGYATLYLEDLPLYVSADSILNTVHLSYESILEALEQSLLSSELDQLLSGMHERLRSGDLAGADASSTTDADLFLAVARSLLAGDLVEPKAGADVTQVRKLVELAEKGQGTADISLFGVARTDEDFSQFKPRSHYTDTPELSRYFRAMIWLGRVDLRLLETQRDGTQLFRRRQLETALLLRRLIGTELRPHFDRVDRTVAAFVGEPDYMVLSELDALMSDLGIAENEGLEGFSDQQLAQAIIDGDYGRQRISSHIMINGSGQGTLPLSRSFALLGQRYVLDSHVFSNVVFDRINDDPQLKRMMPSPLDVAFAALGNDQAGQLLAPELSRFETTGYPSALAKMRLLSDAHPDEFWSGSLYTLWLSALRELSPSATAAAADAGTLFPVARSEAWGRRLLSTQLASWAELRHDTVLYAKQSYTGGESCEFPDAYVDPYPEFFGALSAYGTRGAALLDSLDLGSATPELVGRVRDHFALVTQVSDQLKAMAEHERSGAELTPEMMEFINEAVVVQAVCGGAYFESGWYRRLFFDPSKGVEVSPTIVDVHTQPTEDGAPVGRVLHVGTGTPRLMVVIAEGCSGPRAYAGLAASYREKITKDFLRLDDPTWAMGYHLEPEVPWMQELVTGSLAQPFADNDDP